eukprot:scaffold675_cov103-Cylindrotheca_fusiformis.AAC.9
MASKEGVNDATPSPAPHDKDEDLKSEGQDSNLKGSEEASPQTTEKKGDDPNPGSNSPVHSVSSYPQALPAHLTPQQAGYYVSYPQTQVTPESPAPAGAPTGYDVASFLQPGGFHSSPFGAVHIHQYGASQQPPSSPSQNNAGGMAGSPLFPNLTGQPPVGLLDQHRMFEASLQQRGAPSSPGPHYLSPGVGPVTANGAEFTGWGDNRNPPNSYPPNSPQIGAQGIPIPYVPGMPPRSFNVAERSYSFEESMLPPSAESQQQQPGNQHHDQNYSGGYASSPNNGGFAHQQPAWGYPPGPDIYGMSASPLQQRPTMAYPGMQGGPPRHPASHMTAAYGGGQYFPATSPGPPIQTTTSNKGPDGANLFIFHIPNHFTNMDMYQLFCPYGNLLSVRIMVEKDSGRSRGFGFVSYDSPDAAALAIKELNGFAIGNKRLKVQHKQIRSADQQQDRGGHGQGYDQSGGNQGGASYGRGYMSSALPPSGPMASNASSGSGGGGWHPAQQERSGPADSAEAAVVGGLASSDQEPEQQVNPNESGEDNNNNTGANALSSMDPLRQSLPEVEGNPSN